MPTNLPPEYFQIYDRFRAATTTAERIACLQELLSVIPKHKGTEKLRGDLKRKLAKLRAEAQAPRKRTQHESAFLIEREGAGQAVVVGPANVGKSSLVAVLTNATPEVADYPYTTWEPTPGMMPLENIQVQLIDTPPLSREFMEPQLLQLIRRADLVLLMVDLQADPFAQLEEAVALLEEHRIVPAHRRERFSDARGMAFLPFLVLVNKCDDEGTDEDFQIFRALLEEEWPLLPISTATGRNLELLKRAVFDLLGIVRVYTKVPGREPDLDAPFVLKKGSTVADLASKIHKEFLEKLKCARIWGSALFPGQVVQRDYVLQDGDIVELHV
ncbi:MAG: GTPase [Chloroflexia bacterium]